MGLDVGWIGPLAATFNLLPLVLTVPAGRWMDSGRHRPAAILSSLFLVLATAGFIWSHTLITLILCSAVGGACTLVLNSATQALVAMYSPVERYDARFAMVSLAGSAGQVGGGAVVGLMPSVVTGGSAGSIFAAVAAIAVLVALLALGLRSPRAASGRDPQSARTIERRSTIQILRTPGVAPAIVASLTVLATVDLIGIYLPVLAVERGWSEATVGLLLTLRAVATVLARLVLGLLSRKLGMRRLFVLSVLASAVVIAGVALPVPLPWSSVMLVRARMVTGHHHSW